MRGTALICLLAVAVTALSPFCALTIPAVSDGQPVLGRLDVCHSASPALTPGGLMPCISILPANLSPVIEMSSQPPHSPLFTELIIAVRNERPPRS